MKKIFNIMMAAAIAVCTFTACEDVPEPYNNPLTQFNAGEEEVVIDPVGNGTLDDPYNVTAVIDFVTALGADVTSPNDIYIKGIVTDITEQFGTQYGNATFKIADTETSKTSFTVYRCLYLGNVKFSDASATNINIGDEVVICGKVVNYKGTTPETSQGNAYVYSINGVGGGSSTPEVKVVGSVDNPQTIAQAIAVINALADNATTDEFYYVKGKISKINTTGDDIAKYKNINYVISDGSQTLTVYQGRNLNNTDFTKDGEINVGDEVTVYGQLQKYVKNDQVTPGIAKGNYIAKRNSGDTPAPSTDVKTVSIADFNTAAESDNVWYQLTGTVKNLKDGDLYGNFDLEDATGSVYVYGVLSEKGGAKMLFQDLVAAKGIKEGSKLTIIGTRGSYNGKIEVMNAYFVSVEGGSTPEPTPTPTPSTGAKAISIADFNAAAESTDVWYQLTGTVKNLKDGDLYGNFDLEDATGTVYVYGVLSEKGGAKKLFQDLVAAKGIKEGSKLTIIGNRGSYNGKIEVLNAYFVSVEGGTVTPDPTPSTGGSSLTVTMESFGLANATDLETQTLSDGTTIAFLGEENTNTPKYYTTGAAARVYAKNSLTIKSAGKKITKVVLNCVASYVGNTQIFGEADGKKVTVAQADPTVTFSGFSSQTLKIVNDYTEAKAGTQLRIVSIEITYAD